MSFGSGPKTVAGTAAAARRRTDRRTGTTNTRYGRENEKERERGMQELLRRKRYDKKRERRGSKRGGEAEFRERTQGWTEKERIDENRRGRRHGEA